MGHSGVKQVRKKLRARFGCQASPKEDLRLHLSPWGVGVPCGCVLAVTCPPQHYGTGSAGGDVTFGVVVGLGQEAGWCWWLWSCVLRLCMIDLTPQQTPQFVHLCCGVPVTGFASLRNWDTQDLNVTSLFWEIRGYKDRLFFMFHPKLLYHKLLRDSLLTSRLSYLASLRVLS